MRMARQKQPETIEELLTAALSGLSTEQLIESLANVQEHNELSQKLGPSSAHELWEWIRDKVGVELSTVAVCEGHSSQLQIAWEIYSFQLRKALIVMSRGGSKTSLMAWIDACQCDHYPGFGSFTIGPGRTQGERKYKHLLPLVVEHGVIGGKELEHIARSIATLTEWKIGSSMEIALGASPENANGPREPRLHRDEVELMWKNFQDTYKQAGNIAAGRKTRDGRYCPAQIIDTSTMKWAGGIVDNTIKQFNKDVESGRMPRTQVRISCIFEAAKENPTCRSVPDEARRARLVELGRDPDEICSCDRYFSDVWESEDPNAEPDERTLESVCQGRFFRSRGFKEFDDVQTLFQECDRQTWDAEQECSEPSREGAFLKAYSQIRHGIKDYEPDPENGPIFGGVDWGGVDEHSAGLWQLLERDVWVTSFKSGQRRIQQAGSLVRFAEVFRSGIGNVELGNLVIAMEREFMLRYPGFYVKERYPDSANWAARTDWRDQCGLDTVNYIKKDFNEEVKLVRTRVGGTLFAVDIKACPIFDRSIKAWRQVNGREVHDENSHPLAEFRYVEHNIHAQEKRAGKSRRAGSQGNDPAAAGDEEERALERQAELARATGEVVVTKHGSWGRYEQDQEFDDVGAAESPLVAEHRGDRVLGSGPNRSESSRLDWRL